MFKLLPFLAILGGLASASQLVVNCTTGNLATELGTSLACAKFGGIGLTSVQISLTGGINGTINLTNNSANSQTVTAKTSSDFTVDPSFTLLGFPVYTNPVFTALFSTGSQTIAAGGTFSSAALQNTQTFSLGTSTVLGQFTGGGTFAIPVQTLTSLIITGGGGNVSGVQATTGFLTATVTYNYSAGVVPEPTTVSLIGLGLVGLGFLRRKAR